MVSRIQPGNPELMDLGAHVQVVPASERLESNDIIKVGLAEKANRGEDVILKDDAHHLYVIADGLGGHGAGAVAAEVVTKAIGEYWEREVPEVNPDNAVEHMKAAFVAAQTALVEAGRKGKGSPNMGTVASAIHFFQGEGGEWNAVFGHAGDTRIYVKPAQSIVAQQLTTDEGYGRFVSNAFIADPEKTLELEQFQVVPALEGDRFMICSDGITGDHESESLTEQEMQDAFDQPTPQKSASAFLAYSKKVDDKSVLVLDVNYARQAEGTEVGDQEVVAIETEDVSASESAASNLPRRILRFDDLTGDSGEIGGSAAILEDLAEGLTADGRSLDEAWEDVLFMMPDNASDWGLLSQTEIDAAEEEHLIFDRFESGKSGTQTRKDSNVPGGHEVEATPDAYVGKHRQASWAQRAVEGIKSRMVGKGEGAKPRIQRAQEIGATALGGLRKQGERIRDSRASNFIKTLPASSYLRYVNAKTIALDKKVALAEGDKERWTRNRKIMAGLIAGTIGVGALVIAARHGHNVLGVFNGDEHSHGNNGGHQPGSGHHPVTGGEHHGSKGGASHHGGNPDHGNHGGGNHAHNGQNSESVVSLHKGSTISDQVNEQLKHLGVHYNDHQLYEVVGRTLHHNGLNYTDARHLPVGFQTHLLHPEQIKEILEKSKS